LQRIEFGTDGIRGVEGEWPWMHPIVIRIGQALGEFACRRKQEPIIVIGRDTRPSGDSYLSALITGLLGQGGNVINLGIMTTPGVAFLTRRIHADLGVIVSASHSPIEYNGIKLVGSNGLRLQREEEIEVERLINEFVNDPPMYLTDIGQETNGSNLVEVYIDDHVRYCPVRSLDGFRVVLDCANGSASRVAFEIFKRLNADVREINASIDGKHINFYCGSEHVREHPEDLVLEMQQYDASYGFAFDGDGDRLVVVDREGQVYDGQDLLFVLASYYQEQGLLKGKTVVTTNLSNRGLEDSLRKFDIDVSYASKGDKNLELAMWGGNYLLGAEVGGNIIINDGHHTAADSIFAALVLGGILAQNKKNMKQLVSDFYRYAYKFITFKTSGNISLQQKEMIEKNIESMSPELGEKGRAFFWQSSTQPGHFRLLVEGGAGIPQKVVSRIAHSIHQLIEQVARQT
jgi:phosphoglucosamine mutase